MAIILYIQLKPVQSYRTGTHWQDEGFYLVQGNNMALQKVIFRFGLGMSTLPIALENRQSVIQYFTPG